MNLTQTGRGVRAGQDGDSGAGRPCILGNVPLSRTGRMKSRIVHRIVQSLDCLGSLGLGCG